MNVTKTQHLIPRTDENGTLPSVFAIESACATHTYSAKRFSQIQQLEFHYKIGVTQTTI
jgi:hypothetical protein